MAEALELAWWGHACFELRCCGKTLVIDPHDGGSIGPGFEPPRVKADYVLVTHQHYDHNAVDTVAGEGTVVATAKVGSFEMGPFRVVGVKLPHDEFDGRLRGFVVAYRVEAGGIAVTHLGDAGRPPRGPEAEALRAPYLLAPAGGVYTMPPEDALASAEVLDAKVLIPMHYWLPGVQLPLEPLEVLLSRAKGWRVVRHESHRVVLEASVESKTILVLEPPPTYHGRG